MNTTQTLVYPNELASSVQPYTACLVDQLNAQFRQLDGASQEQMPEVRAKVLAACANTRAAAMGSGVKALEQTSIPDTQRSSYVESIITDLESALLNPKPPSFPAGPEVK